MMRATLSIFATVVMAASLLSSVGKAQITLLPADFKAGLEAGAYNAVIDVRSVMEWESAGHVENATLVADLAADGSPDIILGCESCTIVVYCQTGNRARQAISRLIDEFGFNGTLFNGQGVSQWQDAGYELVHSESAEPPCTKCVKCAGTCPVEQEEVADAAMAGPFSFLGVSVMTMIVAGAVGHWGL